MECLSEIKASFSNREENICVDYSLVANYIAKGDNDNNAQEFDEEAPDEDEEEKIYHHRQNGRADNNTMMMMETFEYGTLKRNHTPAAIINSSSAPRFDLTQSDLVRLLSYLEGELQARDVVIAALKSEKTKQLLNQARYGHLNLNDPLAALQRDSDLNETGDGDSFDETSLGRLYENQLGYLQKLVHIQRRSHRRAKQVLYFLEKRHQRALKQLERENKWRREEQEAHELEREQTGENAYELECIRLTGELEYQKRQNEELRSEMSKLKDSTLHEKERHKSIILYLQGEYERLIEHLERSYAQKKTPTIIDQKSTDSNGSIDQSDRSSTIDLNRKPDLSTTYPPNGEKQVSAIRLLEEIPRLREQLNSRQSEIVQLRKMVKKQEDELIEMRSSNFKKNGFTNGWTNQSRNTPQVNGTRPSDRAIESETSTSIGIDLRQPQQFQHASGVLRRSSITAKSSSAQQQTSKSPNVFSAAKNYLSLASRKSIDRAQASQKSNSNRVIEVDEEFLETIETEIRHLESTESSSTGVEKGGKFKSSNGGVYTEKSIVNVRNGEKKFVFTSSLNGKRDEMEPEIAELEAVLNSLALAASFGEESTSGYIHFPDVQDARVENRGRRNSDQQEAKSTEAKANEDSAASSSSIPSTPILNRSKSLISNSLNSITAAESPKKPSSSNLPARIPIVINRKSSSSTKEANGHAINKDQSSPATSSTSSSAEQLSSTTTTTSSKSTSHLQDERKSSLPAGCASPHLALKRKVKAISGLANRIQQRVVNQVGGGKQQKHGGGNS